MIATVASSASLVLLGLYVQVLTENGWNGAETDEKKRIEEIRVSVITMGVLFAIAGILYRDLTALTIHREDERFLRKYDCNSKDPSRRLISCIRAFVLHMLLILPIIAWFLIACSVDFGAAVFIVGFSYSAIISFFEGADPCSWEESKKSN